jgi:hypothetical protein
VNNLGAWLAREGLRGEIVLVVTEIPAYNGR